MHCSGFRNPKIGIKCIIFKPCLFLYIIYLSKDHNESSKLFQKELFCSKAALTSVILVQKYRELAYFFTFFSLINFCLI